MRFRVFEMLGMVDQVTKLGRDLPWLTQPFKQPQRTGIHPSMRGAPAIEIPPLRPIRAETLLIATAGRTLVSRGAGHPQGSRTEAE
jgi:hypothetical protein